MQDFLENFGVEVRRKRKKRSLTQGELAARLNMSNRTIMDIIARKRRDDKRKIAPKPLRKL